MKSRDVRRHHSQRIKNRVKNIWLNIWNDKHYRSMPEEELAKRISAHSTTRKRCSCFMCGNERRYFNEVTLQEKKANEASKVTD
jgi:hypothetical protein